MKKILISGENSYIGKSFYNMMSRIKEDYKVDFISVRGNEWETKNFGEYDVFLHLAGKAHVSRNKKLKNEYYEVNTNLTTRLAEKSKKDGVKHFIFMSSIIVYGNRNEMINLSTKTDPDDFYGDSKIMAEKNIVNLSNNNFFVTVLRPPMVYGYKSKGNFDKLKKLAAISPFFPLINNKRSVIYIENLNEFVKWIIDNKKSGVFMPADLKVVSTSEIYSAIRSANRKKTILIPIPKLLIKLLLRQSFFRKIFGNLYYESQINNISSNMIKYSFRNAIEEITTQESSEYLT